MLSKEDNDLVTRAGPGTALGELMRRFWLPIALSRELARPEGEPVRLKIMGEALVAFRDSEGHVGLLEEACPHRQSSLFFGRNEECGLRCAYHGWKFDRNGNCMDMPSEPQTSTMKSKIHAKAYPVRERGGLLWAYMGPAGSVAAFPEFDWLELPASHVYVSRWLAESNYLQALEGEFDTGHVGFLHRNLHAFADSPYHVAGRYFQEDLVPKWHVEQTDGGMLAAAYRVVDGKALWRWNHFLLPIFSMLSAEPQRPQFMRAWLPTDDENTSVICISFCYDRPLSDSEIQEFKTGESAHRNVMPGTLFPVANRANNYLIDREVQRTVNYSGIRGIRNQDAAACESQGIIADRSREHLGTNDTGVIQLRRCLINAMRKLATGQEPAGARRGELFAIRPGQAHVPLDLAYHEVDAIHESMKPRQPVRLAS